MWTAKFWKDLTERMIASAAGGALAVIGAGELTGDGSVSWQAMLLGAGVAALVSFLKGLIASQKGDATSASLVQ
jgi:r1t holin